MDEFQDKTTDDLYEGKRNKFHTDERVLDVIDDTLVAGEGIELETKDKKTIIKKKKETTDDIAEGGNLYHTKERVKEIFDEVIGTELTELTDSFDKKINSIPLIKEKKYQGDNFISTEIIDDTVKINFNPKEIRINQDQIENLSQYTELDFNRDLSHKTTDDITEGNNLFYTSDRAKKDAFEVLEKYEKDKPTLKIYTDSDAKNALKEELIKKDKLISLHEEKLNIQDRNINKLISTSARYLLDDGTRPLISDWDAGNFNIKARSFESTVETGTQPIKVVSESLIEHLNADFLDGYHASSFAFRYHTHVAADIIGLSTDHGTLTGLSDDDHTQYIIKSPQTDSRNTITAGTAVTTPLYLINTQTTENDIFGYLSNVSLDDGDTFTYSQYAGYFYATGATSKYASYGIYGISDATNFSLESIGVYGSGKTAGVFGKGTGNGSIGVSGSQVSGGTGVKGSGGGEGAIGVSGVSGGVSGIGVSGSVSSSSSIAIKGDTGTSSSIAGYFISNNASSKVLYAEQGNASGYALYTLGGKNYMQTPLEIAQATGTAPFTITSTTKVANLNVDQLDGFDESAFALLAGRSGGQTLIGGTASGDDLTLQSTSNATKGNIFFGNSTYDEVNNRLGIGIVSSIGNYIHVKGSSITGFGSSGACIILEATTGEALFKPMADNSTNFAGVEYLDTTGATGVFTGFRQSTGEFRFNNVYSGGYIDFMINSVVAARINNSSNIGLGTSTIPAGTTGQLLTCFGTDANIMAEKSGAAGNSLNISQNAAFNSTVWKYIESSAASNYYQNSGTHVWRVAGSGTAGNSITWATALKIASAGSLQVSDGSVQTDISVLGATSQKGFFSMYNGISIWSVNRRPSDGSFTDSTKAAAQIQIESAASNSEIRLYTTATNNAIPSLRLTLDKNGLLTFSEAINMAFGATTGTKIGTATDQKLAFHNSTPVIQRAGAAQAAVATTASTQTTPWGYSTQAQADAIVTLVNELRAAMVEKGLIKGSA